MPSPMSLRLSLLMFPGLLLFGTSEVRAQGGTKVALVIGVNRYENKKALGQQDLACADADANAFARTLVNGGFERDNLILMTTQRTADNSLYPRAANVRKELKALVQNCTEADTLLITFSGYERQLAGTRDYFLCTSDADPANPRSMVSLREMYRELANCKAGLKLVVIDACRGLEKEAGGMPESPEGVATFIGCSAGQIANEVAALRQGVFTYCLLEGLRGAADSNKDGKVTVPELEAYARQRVPAFCTEQKLDQQLPELLGATSRSMPLVSVLSR